MSSILIVYFLIGVLPPPIVMSLLSYGLATFDSNLSLSAFSLISPFTFALLAVFAFSPFRFLFFPFRFFALFLTFRVCFFRYCRLLPYASAKTNYLAGRSQAGR